jgi:hypothetical protein
VENSKLVKIATRIASRHAWEPPPTSSGESLTLLEYAGPVGPEEEIVEHDGEKYVVRGPIAEPAKPGEW